MLNMMKIVEQFKKQISNKINQQSYKRRILQTSFRIVSEKHIDEREWRIFAIATLELDVLCKIHDIYLNYYCS